MNRKKLLKTLAMPIALVAICTYFALQRHGFWSARNFSQLLVQFSIIGTLALGMFMILLTGQIDLSVGSGVGLIGGIAAVLITKHDWSAPLALAAAFAVALVLWSLMGTLIVKERIPSFIITLGGLLIFRGLFWLVIESTTIPIRGVQPNLFSRINDYLPVRAGYVLACILSLCAGFLQWRSRKARAAHGLPVPSTGKTLSRFIAVTGAIFAVTAGCNNFFGLPYTLLILTATASAVYALTQHTPFGRYLYAIGGNEEAANLSGINVDLVLIGAYVLMGATTALTGFMQTSFEGNSGTSDGQLMELDAIAACVIGGTALKGGRGTVWGVLFGALIMTTLLNGMGIEGVSPEMKYIARGTVLALAVWLDVRLGRD